MLRNEIHATEGLDVRMNHPLATLITQFLKERTYLQNVSERTLVWYRVAFKNYQAVIPADAAVLPTKATLQQFVVALRERGIRPVTCNTYVGAMNAFCAWLHQEGHARERVKLQKLRVERRLLTLLDDAQMRAMIGYKPKTFRQARVHLAALLILDTGLRISEALHVRDSDADCDNLILKVLGKGQKERLVPFSPELRPPVVSLPATQGEEGHHERVPVRGVRRHALGEAQQHDVALPAAGQTQATALRLASPAAHVCHQLPSSRWRHRSTLDGPGAHPDHDDPTLLAPRSQ